ncbi:MAG TPA: MFS transporter [Blastocatellia bacterium]|nr:MFS transporter [Blastocatellia bacterium]
MPKSRSPLVIIFITIFIDLVGFGIVIPVLPLYAERYGASEATVGVLLAIYSAMQFIFAPILGKLSDRVGRRPVLLVSLIGTSIGFLIMGLAPKMPFGFALLGMAPALVWLFIARIIDGISGGNISTAQAYIADVTPPEHRSRGMGLIGAAFGLGFIFGPAIGGLMSHVSPEAPFFFASAMAAANATALYFFLPESLSHEHRTQAGGRVTISQVFERSGWHLKAIMATYFFATVSFAMLTATYALFANHRFNFDAIHTGYMFTYLGVLGAIIQGGLLGRLVKIFGEKLLAVTGTAIFAVSISALPSSASLATLLLGSTGIAIGNSLMTPTLNGLASKSVSAAMQGRMLGVMASVASLARIIGPVLGGWLLSLDANQEWHYGRSPYWTSGAIMLVALGLAITLRSVHESVDGESAAVERSGAQPSE